MSSFTSSDKTFLDEASCDWARLELDCAGLFLRESWALSESLVSPQEQLCDIDGDGEVRRECVTESFVEIAGEIMGGEELLER